MNIYRRPLCIDNMSSEVTHITSSHRASEPNFLTSWVSQSRIIEERLHELERRKTVSYGCFYFSHINGGWHRFYDLVDCSALHKLEYLCVDIFSVTQPHAHVDTEPSDRQRHGTFNPKYFLQLSFCLSVSLLSSPHTCFLKDFQAVGSPVVASIVIAKT